MARRQEIMGTELVAIDTARRRTLDLTDAGRACADRGPNASGLCSGVVPHGTRGVAAGDVNVLDDRDGATMFEFADPDGNA